jgi:hypothetical protein
MSCQELQIVSNPVNDFVMSGYDPDAETIGKYILAFVESAGTVSPVFERKVRETFETEIGEVEADGWYRNDDVKGAYHSVLNKVGPKTMKQGGKATSGALDFPADTSVEEALTLLQKEHSADGVYRNTTSDTPAGQYTFEISGNSAHLGATEGYPYTKPFVEGLYKGIIEEYSNSAPELTETTPKAGEQFAWDATW